MTEAQRWSQHPPTIIFCRTPVSGLGLGVDFTFTWDNNNKNNNNENNDKNPHLNFVTGTELGAKEQRVGIRELDTEDQVLFLMASKQ